MNDSLAFVLSKILTCPMLDYWSDIHGLIHEAHMNKCTLLKKMLGSNQRKFINKLN